MAYDKEKRAAYDKEYHQKNREKILAKKKESYQKNRASHLIRSAKHRAIKKNIPFDLDQFVDEIQARIDDGVCELLGIPFDFNIKNGRWDSLR